MPRSIPVTYSKAVAVAIASTMPARIPVSWCRSLATRIATAPPSNRRSNAAFAFIGSAPGRKALSG